MARDPNDEPSVKDGVVLRTSVSAMQKADGCARQYRFKYVDRLPDKPEGKGAKRGKEGHARVEHYLKTGENVLDPLEQLGLEYGYFPAPRVGFVEYDFEKAGFLAGDIPMRGYIDHVDPCPSDIACRVTDWKFKKSISKYGCADEDLADPTHEAGIQMLGYGALAVKVWGPPLVELRHVTFQTEGRRDVKPTATVVSAEEITKRWAQVTERIVPKLRQAAAAKTYHEVPKNLDVCEKYGGCAYKSTCLDRVSMIKNRFLKSNEYPKKVLDGVSDSPIPSLPQPASPVAPKGLLTMGLLTTPGSLPSPVVQPPPTPTVVPTAGVTLIDAKDAEQGHRYLVNGAKGTFLCGVAISGKTFYSFSMDGGGQPALILAGVKVVLLNEPPVVIAAQVLPPDAPKSNPPTPIGVITTPTVVPSVPQTEQQAVALLQASIAKEEKPKKVRRMRIEEKGVEVETPPIPVTVVAQPSVEVPIQAPLPPPVIVEPPVVKKEKPPAKAGPSGIHLYYGCSPIGTKTDSLIAYTNEIDAKFEEATQLTCEDLRSCNTQEFGFGKWRGFLARVAVENPPPPGHYVVTRGDERLEVIAAALQAIATQVVMGGVF